MLDDVKSPVLLVRGERHVIDTTWVMGVVNASPESFSDGGRFSSVEEQQELAESFVEAGAEIVDIGGQSAITNQPELDAELEAERVVPLVEWLHAMYPSLIISVDTYKPLVAEAALAAGGSILNDVSGLLYTDVVTSCIKHQAALVVMHTAARPKVRLQDRDLYDGVAREVRAFLADRMAVAVGLGLPEESVVLDPGPDFTKTPHQTIAVLRDVPQLRRFGRPLLLALSRKDFLGAITGRSPRGREAATAAAIAYFATCPGGIVRVHDVAAARDVIATVETLSGRRDIDRGYLLPDEVRHEPRRG